MFSWFKTFKFVQKTTFPMPHKQGILNSDIMEIQTEGSEKANERTKKGTA